MCKKCAWLGVRSGTKGWSDEKQQAAPGLQHARRSENFFQLPDSVVLEEVSSDEELKVLKRKSLSWSCVGLDTESLRGGKCALLQVGTGAVALCGMKS